MIVLLIIGTILLGGTSILSRNKPLLEGGFAEMMTYVYASGNGDGKEPIILQNNILLETQPYWKVTSDGKHEIDIISSTQLPKNLWNITIRLYLSDNNLINRDIKVRRFRLNQTNRIYNFETTRKLQKRNYLF